jgi:signal transduction histidine kinase
MNRCRLIVVRDISALINSERLRSVEKLSEIMIASTSHDMRTPLNTIINMLLLIEARVNDPDLLTSYRSQHGVLDHLKRWVRIASNSTHLL